MECLRENLRTHKYLGITGAAMLLWLIVALLYGWLLQQQILSFDISGWQEAYLGVIDAIDVRMASWLFAIWRSTLLILPLWVLGVCILIGREIALLDHDHRRSALLYVLAILLGIADIAVQIAIYQSSEFMNVVRMPIFVVALLVFVSWTLWGLSNAFASYLYYIVTGGLFVLLHINALDILTGIFTSLKDYDVVIQNLYLLSIVLICVYLIIGRPCLSMLIVSLLVGFMGLVDHYYYTYRGTPIELIDYLLAGTAADVVGNYNLAPNLQIWMYLVVEAAFLCCLCLIPESKRRNWRGMAIAALYSVVGVCWAVSYTPNVSYWNKVETTRELGYLCSFLAYARHDLVVNKPNSYSRPAAIEILDRYDMVTDSTNDYIDLIVIMDESFSDLPCTYSFNTDTDGMPFLHSLKENTVRGNLLVSVLGGSTADTEWEFLTGCSMAFSGGGGAPYVQYVKSDTESLASELLDLGYQTTAFHPCTRTNYDRDVAYPHLGFEQFVAIEDYLVSNDLLRTYVTDHADVIDLLDIYTRNAEEDRPQFLFNVTMQNHGGYNGTEDSVDVTVRATDEDLQSEQLEEYLSLILATDEAMEELITYYQESDRKTVVLIYGDHQPALDNEVTEAMESHLVASGVDNSNGQERYITPFILWANYDIEEAEDVLISPGYLRAFLLKTAGLPLGSWDQFLLECYESYPAINSMGYYDADRQWHSWDNLTAADALLQEYKVLQYGKVFDKGMNVAEY